MPVRYRKDPVYCEYCGKLIENAIGNRKYHPECAKEMKKRYNKVHHNGDCKDKYGKIISDMKVENDRKRNQNNDFLTIAQIAKAAVKEGLSYGKYVAKYHL